MSGFGQPWYQHTLSDGVTVDEAQPGNYYVVNGYGQEEPAEAPLTPNLGVTAWAALSTASSGVSAYHGYKRNQSIGWALAWAAAGALFPVITPTIAVAQGFGKRKSGR
jgi:hypothetical protein